MKILSFLLKKTKTSSFIGFVCAMSVYLFAGGLILEFSSQKSSNLKLEGNHSITLKLASIDSGGDSTKLSKEITKPKPPKKVPPKEKPNPPAPSQATPAEQEKLEEDQSAQPLSNLTQEGGETQTLAYNEGLSDEFLSKIHAAISASNPYPRMARMRRMEGEVVLEFVLDTDGKLEGIKILSSTASDLLDKGAIKALNRASKDFPIPPKKVRIKVPIIYSLQA